VSEAPVLDFEVGHGSGLVVVADLHGSLVGGVVDGLGSQEPLSPFPESFEDVVGADLHNRNLFVGTGVSALVSGTGLELSDFSVATPGDLGGLEGHEFGLLHVEVALSSVLDIKSLIFSIGVPVVVSLDVSMLLIERVIQVSPKPGELRDVAEVEGHLGVLAGNVVVVRAQRVDHLVQVGVDDRVTKVVVGLALMPEVLGDLRVIEVNCRHYLSIIIN